MELSNILVYDNRLQCASEDVAMATMCIPKWDSCLKPDWLERVVSPQNPVVFLNTDKVSVKSPIYYICINVVLHTHIDLI